MESEQESIIGKVLPKLVSLIHCELNKTENKSKIDSATNHVTSLILKQVHPYIFSVILIMLLILLMQGFLISKLIQLQSRIF